MKKFLALVLALVMTMSLVTVGASAKTAFTDDAKITNAEAVEVLNAMGVLTGYADGSFRPEGVLTRGAGAKLIAYIVLGQAKADKLAATYTVFEDVTDTVGLAAYIEWAAANGIVDGYGDGNFGPYNQLTEYAFGKMLLTALGYESAEEGFTGAGWQKNVYTLAVRNEIFDGSETWGACTRDTAARMTFGALQADLVAYGHDFVGGKYVWNGYTFTGSFGIVAGAVSLGKTLGELYGLEYADAYDIFDRPGHTWTYKPAKWSKFYMDAPVAEYTTAVSECDILVDLGVAKTNKTSLDGYYNAHNGTYETFGSYNSFTLNHKTCNGVHGGQGTLTQVFETAEGYVITEISTYLAYVSGVKAAVHGNIGDEAKLNVYSACADDADCYETVWVENITGLTKGDWLLVNIADDTDGETYVLADEYSIYGNSMGEYLSIVGTPETFEGKMTAATTPESVVVRTIAGKTYSDAAEYELGFMPAYKTNYTWFVDQYGNVIGNADFSVATHKYGRIDAIKWYNDGLVNTKEFASANLVTAEGTTVTETAVELGSWDKVLAHYNVEQNAALNGWYYSEANNYGVVAYTEKSDGSFAAEKAGNIVYGFDGKVSGKNVKLGYSSFWGYNERAIYADDETQFLVLTGYTATGAEIYEAFTGIANLKDMTGVSAMVAVVEEAIVDGVQAYAEFVYIDAHNALYPGSSVEAYVFSDASTKYDAETGLFTYVIWVNGEKTEIQAATDKLFGRNFTAGLYHVAFNLAGEAVSVAECIHFSGECVEFVGANAVNDWYVGATTTVYVVGANEITAGSIEDIDVPGDAGWFGNNGEYHDHVLVKAVAGSSVQVADTIYLFNAVEGLACRQ